MTREEKLEIIDKALENLYEELEEIEDFVTVAQKDITQAIYNLESTKELLNTKYFISQGGEVCKKM